MASFLRRIPVSLKVLLLVFVLVSGSVLAESLFTFLTTKQIIRERDEDRLKLAVENFEQKLEAHFEERRHELEFLTQGEIGKKLWELRGITHSHNDSLRAIAKEKRALLRENYLNSFTKNFGYKDIYVVNGNGRLLYHQEDLELNNVQFHNLNNSTIDPYKPHFYVNKPTLEPKAGKIASFAYLSLPILDENNKVVGAIVGKLDIVPILEHFREKILTTHPQMHLFCYQDSPQGIFYLHNEWPEELGGNVSSFKPKGEDPFYRSASSDITEHGFYTFPNGEEQLSYWKHSSNFDIGIMATFESRVFGNTLADFLYVAGTCGLVLILLTSLISFHTSQILTQPLIKLKQALMLISQGVLPPKLKTPWKDEIGEMIATLNQLVYNLRHTADFARKIGEGHFYSSFQPLSDRDILGQALVNMRSSLHKAETNDALRNWIVLGIAETGEILRETKTLTQLGDELLQYLCQRVDAIQGGFFVVEKQDGNNSVIDLRASYAYERKKYIDAKFEVGEGLIGQAVLEKDTILRTEIPNDYMHVSSGLLETQSPTCIAIIPLITNETVYGVLELVSFHKFSEGEIQFLEEVSEIIAQTISNTKHQEEKQRLHEQSEEMNVILQERQKELQENALKMAASQEEIQEANKALEHQITEVNNAQHRIQALLENASEVITIYDEEGTVQYVSPSVEHILGYRPEEMIGSRDINFVHKNEQGLVREMFERLLNDDSCLETVTISYYRKTGDKIWLEATGRNMLENPAIQGIVVNYRDITERLRAEQEERKRGQMQALSENSPDIITRISRQKTFFYSNPAITNLTGKRPEELRNKMLTLSGLDEKITTHLSELVDQVTENRSKVNVELDLPSTKGERTMAVNAIPEFNEHEELESILVVSHDITEQKATENEIKRKNRKINDSINYAEHLQNAILPHESILQQSLPNSFIFFRPKDVVSGDFPWMMKKNGFTYIAAVDCTGHGVPGAMLSIIGYFLLNDIVKNEEANCPGTILDLLDERLGHTLKQGNTDGEVKDGMDIALCKISDDHSTLEYAGAQRPLYLIKPDGELIETKGDKFPIGGGSAYENKKFTTHQIPVEQGDALYFFSDGFPDQFGGPSQRKFGPRRIKNLVQENAGKPFGIIKDSLSCSFNEWQGTGKQTDDVLLIGIQL